MLAITGATGFLGCYICTKLSDPHKCLSRQLISSSSANRIWIQGDLSLQKSMDAFVKDSSVLIHLACSSNPRTSDLNWLTDIQNNLISSVNLFEAYAKANSGGHIILASTGGNMYEALDDSHAHSEGDLPEPRSSYGIHKLAIEHYLRLLCLNQGLCGTVLRISNPYGVLVPSQRAQGLIGVVFSKLLANESLQIFDSMESVRDYIHLEDMTRAFEMAMQQPPQKGECRTFNVGSGVGHSMAEVLSIIEATTKQTIAKQFQPSSNQKPTSSILCNEKIRDVLGWSPAIGLKEGVQMMWERCSQPVEV